MSRALGTIDLLGLKDFGPGMSPIYGTLIGGGVSAITTLTLRHTGHGRFAELFGVGTGLAISGVLFAMKSTKRAGVGALVGTLFAAGVMLFDRYVLGNLTAPAPVVAAGAQAVAGMGIPEIRALNGLGIPEIRALNGFGIPMVAGRTQPAGAIPGVAGTQLGSAGMPPVSLLGSGSPQAAHLLGMGGPAVHGLSSAYGATLLGGGR